MLKYGYEEIEEHKSSHQELIEAAKELQDKILQSDKPMADEDLVFLERLLTAHVLTNDMKLGTYLSQVM